MNAQRSAHFWAHRLALEARLSCAVPGDTLLLCVRSQSECPTQACPNCLQVKVTPKLTPADVAAGIERSLAMR